MKERESNVIQNLKTVVLFIWIVVFIWTVIFILLYIVHEIDRVHDRETIIHTIQQGCQR